MSEPKLLKEEPVVVTQYGKKVATRYYLDSDGKERDFMVWGGVVTPAMVFSVTTDKKVIVIKMFRRGANESVIEISGGNPRIGEAIEDCARREFEDETGYVAEKIIRLAPYLWFEPAACFTCYVPFLALGCRKKREQNLDKSEVAEGMHLQLFKLSEWVKMILSGKISDDKTIALTFLSLPYLGLEMTLGSIPLL